MSANPEIEELVRKLEAAQEGELELGRDVSADDIAQEFQRFLRQRGTDKTLGTGPPDCGRRLRPLRRGRSGGSRTSEQIS